MVSGLYPIAYVEIMFSTVYKKYSCGLHSFSYMASKLSWNSLPDSFSLSLVTLNVFMPLLMLIMHIIRRSKISCAKEQQSRCLLHPD